MKKLARKMVAICIGLVLGWYCAGLADRATFQLSAEAHAAAPHGQHAEPDAGQLSASQLLPGEGQTPFFRPVVNGAIALFVLAAVIGMLSRSLGYKDPAAVAAEEDQQAEHHDHHAGDHQDSHHAPAHH